MTEEQLEIETKDGVIDTYVCHPDRGAPWPVIIMYMDAPGIREELRDMARRLGSVGYYVMLPNLYYRTAGEIVIDPTKLHEDGPDRERLNEMIDTINTPMVVEDTAAIITFIDEDPKADPARIGCLGYCMSGPFAYASAARFADRINAVAVMFGTFLVTEAADSPHKLSAQIRGEVYLGFAENDRFSPPGLIRTISDTLVGAGVKHEVEIYSAVDHAFAFPLRKGYDRVAADRHWERLFDLFGRTLKNN